MNKSSIKKPNWQLEKKASFRTVKLVLVGDSGAGKTSLINRIKGGTLNPNIEPTDKINIAKIPLGPTYSFDNKKNKREIIGHFWDFAEEEAVSFTDQFFFTGRTFYLLILDAREDKDVEGRIRDWVYRIRNTGGYSPIIVACNKIEINPSFSFGNEAKMLEEFPQIKAFLKVSCHEGKNIESLISLLQQYIPHTKIFETEVEKQWHLITAKLSKESSKSQYINETPFKKICKKYLLESENSQRRLVALLHDLGEVIHFQGSRKNLAEYYILDPKWITYGVYQILNSHYARKCEGLVPINMLEYIINKEQSYQPKNGIKIEYSTGERAFLLDLLHEFKLCYYVNERKHFIIPNFLKTRVPSFFKNPFLKTPEGLNFIYEYSILPESIVPEIMVECYSLLEDIWKTGCILKLDESRAVINVDHNQVYITVEGQHKINREFMSIIRYIIDLINKKLDKIPRMLIPLPNLPNEFVSYKRLLNLEKRGKIHYRHYLEEDEDDFIQYEISILLEGISPLNELQEFRKEIQQLKITHDKSYSGIQKIIRNQWNHFEYLTHDFPREWSQNLLNEIESLQFEQTKNIQQDMIEALGKAFELHQEDMDEQLKDIYLKMTEPQSLTSLKLKAGLPLLVQMVTGLNVEAEFDLKAWSERMYKKYELKLFKVMGKIG